MLSNDRRREIMKNHRLGRENEVQRIGLSYIRITQPSKCERPSLSAKMGAWLEQVGRRLQGDSTPNAMKHVRQGAQ